MAQNVSFIALNDGTYFQNVQMYSGILWTCID